MGRKKKSQCDTGTINNEVFFKTKDFIFIFAKDKFQFRRKQFGDGKIH